MRHKYRKTWIKDEMLKGISWKENRGTYKLWDKFIMTINRESNLDADTFLVEVKNKWIPHLERYGETEAQKVKRLGQF